jgi:hypothetical protein
MNTQLVIPDCLFPSDNDLEVPTLRLDRQPEFCDIPFVCYGEQARTFQMNGNGTLHFYTDDYRFTALYEHPENILKMHPKNIVEPNFSLFSETPVAFGLQALYKKRFIARAMQERGINVFVDLNVNSKFYKLNMLGVPAGWSAFCTRGYNNRLAYLRFEWELAKNWAGDNRLLFVIYGGGRAAKDFAQKHGCVYVEQLVNVKGKVKRLESELAKIAGTIAFQEPEMDAKRLIGEAISKTAGSQVADFTNQQKRLQ